MAKKGRNLIFLLFLVLFSCTSKPQWIYQETVGDCLIYNSVLLEHPPCIEFNGISLSFLKTSAGIQTSVAVVCRKLISNELIVAAKEEANCFFMIPLMGDQKALLPEEASEFIIKKLCSGQDITLAFPGYIENISWKGFKTCYNKFANFYIETQ